MWMQGCRLSGMTAALQCLDPLLTAYLDWRLLLRNLLANALPDLPAASSDSLLQLKQAMQQADSNADGLLTQDELMTLDVSMLLTSLIAASAAAEDADVAAITEQEGNSDEQTADSTEDAQPETDVQSEHQDEVQAASQVDTDTNEEALQGTALQKDSENPDEAQLAEAGPDLNRAAEHVKALLCQALWGDDSSADIDIDEIMLFLSCAEDGKEGLQKAFDVLTGGREDSQVRTIGIKMQCCCGAMDSNLASKLGCHDHRWMRVS